MLAEVLPGVVAGPVAAKPLPLIGMFPGQGAQAPGAFADVGRRAPDMLAAVEKRVPMPQHMKEQMPDLMPQAMDRLMPKMLPQIVPLISDPLIAYLRGQEIELVPGARA